MSLHGSMCALAVIAAAGACASDGLTAPVVAPPATSESHLAAALQGRLPGVQIRTGGSAPASMRVACRLGGERLDGREPLFVIDDVPMTQAEMQAAELNVRQIEEIYLLKPAQAVNRYGDRARDGAVLITTRRL